MCIYSGVLCVVSATVPTLFGGAMNEASVLKSGRIHQIAMENRLPTITLTQSVRFFFCFYIYKQKKFQKRIYARKIYHYCYYYS